MPRHQTCAPQVQLNNPETQPGMVYLVDSMLSQSGLLGLCRIGEKRVTPVLTLGQQLHMQIACREDDHLKATAQVLHAEK